MHNEDASEMRLLPGDPHLDGDGPRRRDVPKQYCCGKIASRRHCVGLWVISFAVLLGLSATIGYFVAAPLLAKHYISEAELVLTQINITNPGVDTATFTTTGYLDNVGHTAIIKRTNMTVWYKGSAICHVMMPETRVVGGERTAIRMTDNVTIINADAFDAFGQDLLEKDTVTWTFSGSPEVACPIMGLFDVELEVDFEKAVNISGCGGFKNVTLEVFSLGRSTKTEVVADLVILAHNPSVANVDIGQLTFHLFYEGDFMGTMLNEESWLYQGDNVMRLSGYLRPSNGTAADALISAYLSGRPTTVTARGVADNSTSPLYRNVISAFVLTQTLTGSANALVDGLFVHELKLEMRDEASVMLSLNATVEADDPLGPNSPMLIDTVALNLDVTGEGEAVGHVAIPPTPVHEEQDSSQYGRLGMGYSEGSQYAVAYVSGRNERPWSPALQRGLARRLNTAELTSSDVLPGGLGTLNITMAVRTVLKLENQGRGLVDMVGHFVQENVVHVGLVSSADDAMVVAFRSALFPGEEHASIPIDITSALPGMRGLNGSKVLTFSILGDAPAPERGIILTAVVELFNPSPTSIPLGTEVDFVVMDDQGFTLGHVAVQRPTLVPGTSTLALRGLIDPQPDALAATGRFISNYVTGRDNHVTVQGAAVKNGNESTPHWMQEAVKELKIGTVFKGNNSMQIYDLTPQFLSFAFDEHDFDAPPKLSGELTAMIQIPFSISIDIKRADCIVRVVTAAGYEAGYAEAVNQTVAYTPMGGKAKLSLTVSGIQMTITNATAFNEVLIALLMEPYAVIGFSGTASPYAETVVGTIPLTNLPLSGRLKVKGVNHFSNPPISLQSLSVQNANASQLDVTGTLSVCNPSIVHVYLGPVSLHMGFEGLVTAIASTTDFDLPYLACTDMNVTGALLKPPASAGADALSTFETMLSNYLEGKNQTVSVLGFPGTSPIKLIQPALMAFKGSAVLPGLTTQLVQKGTIKLDILKILGGNAPTGMTLFNPFSIGMEILDANLTIYGCDDELSSGACVKYGSELGTYTQDDLYKDPIVLSPGPAVTTVPPHSTRMGGDMSATLKAFINAIFNKHHATVRGDGRMLARVGGADGMTLNASYAVEGVELTLAL